MQLLAQRAVDAFGAKRVRCLRVYLGLATGYAVRPW